MLEKERASCIASVFYDKYLYNKSPVDILERLKSSKYSDIEINEHEDDGWNYCKLEIVIYFRSKMYEKDGLNGKLKYGVYVEIAINDDIVEVAPVCKYEFDSADFYPDDFWCENDIIEATTLLDELIL